jgi:riboflavin synthase
VFTGIVQGLCEVVEIEHKANLSCLYIDLGELAKDLALGASVAVNGTCLTVGRRRANPKVTGTVTGFDVIKESLALTNLGTLIPGSRVNVERSLKFGDEIGGHILSGHIATTVVVDHLETSPNERVLWFACEPHWLKYLNHKGFVALDGASLTISGIDREAGLFSVSLIPETLARTTLGTHEVGAPVNLEVEAQTQTIVETVERLLGDEEWRASLFPRA